MKKALILVLSAAVGGVIALQLNQAFNRAQPMFRVVDRTPVTVANTGTLPVPTDFTQAAERLLPSVVSIDTVSESMNLFGPVRRAETGSGVIYSPDGLIITNAHVVGQRPTGITVHLADGKSFPARVVGTDPISDLAVLRIDAKDLTPATFGSSGELKVGQWVIAVGNPLGQQHTLSVGVVSSLGRDLSTNQQGVLIGAIQTDAAINPGNSGGALANAQGQVVGINSAILSGSDRMSIGIGFAIPIDRAKPILEDLIKLGRARYGVHGMRLHPEGNLIQFSDVRRAYVRQFNAEPPEYGQVVERVSTGSPADQAGIRPYDIILKLDNVELKERFDFVRFMAERKPGDKVSVTFWSQGKTSTVQLTLVDVSEI